MHAGRAIGALWAILIIYWVVSAFGNKKTKIRQGRGSRLAYVGGMALAVFIISSQKGVNVPLFPVNALTKSAAILLCAAGVGIAIWARSILGKNWSGFVSVKEGHELIQRGPYQFVRHPIYTGIILAYAGTVLALIPTARGLLIEMVLILAFTIKSRHEEHLMAGEFGAQYAEYKQRVKGTLIPYLF
jgi:protein-S-isoprenylcysteine O-methyltransferase Ste14